MKTNSIPVSGIDHYFMIFYILRILLVDPNFKKSVESPKEYFLGDKRLLFWVMEIQIVVSDIWAIHFVGVSDQEYKCRLAVGNFVTGINSKLQIYVNLPVVLIDPIINYHGPSPSIQRKEPSPLRRGASGNKTLLMLFNDFKYQHQIQYT